jgi:hypothetical protein
MKNSLRKLGIGGSEEQSTCFLQVLLIRVGREIRLAGV